MEKQFFYVYKFHNFKEKSYDILDKISLATGLYYIKEILLVCPFSFYNFWVCNFSSFSIIFQILISLSSDAEAIISY